ncbi:MAG: nucleotide sugar dehydrogenase [SAR202 cluster bacterium]|jgi:UDP-N-acetyl-D-glucosamine dehydrogenase|nr:nucleotide sugar dehydrogenase [SAR202 cluster bacterium]
MNLFEKISSRRAVVSVIGLGYVGLPLAIEFARAGFRVIAIDNDENRVNQINNGESYLPGVSSNELGELKKANTNSLIATSDYAVLDETDAVLVCVPTPLSKTKDPDLSYIIAVADEISVRLRPGMLVVLESTTYPGSTEEVILPKLTNSNGRSLKPGSDFFLAFSPERIDPGRKDHTLTNTPKVLGGVTEQCGQAASALYKTVIETVVPVSSPKVAEMVKLLENTFRATNIALVNEIAIMCERLGIDVWEVIDAAKTKPFGFMPFYPGPGLGGHCIPIDPQYLAWKLRTLNYNAKFIQLADEINTGMPQYVQDKIASLLNEAGKPLKQSEILVLGVSYKPDVGDVRESPALDLMDLLVNKGAHVRYNDPHVPTVDINGTVFNSETLSEDLLNSTNCVVVVTPHSSYDWSWILSNTTLLLDTRNALAGVPPSEARVVTL